MVAGVAARRRPARRGAARRRRPRRTSTRTRRTRRAGCARSMRPNVATSQNTVVPPLPSTISQPSGRPNSSVSPARTDADEALHRRLAVATCRAPSAGGERAASSCSGRTFDGPQPKRPSAGSRSVGMVNVGSGSRRGHCDSMARHLRRHPRIADRRAVAPCRPCNDRVSARLAAIAESATLAVDAKAKALKAQGENVIGFGAGEPDFPTPEHIVEAAVAACRDPKNHRYTPAAGLPELREAIAAKTERDSGFDCTAGQVLVTNGGKHAVFTAFAALCDPGDEVICPAPYWTTYPEAITLAGGVPVVIDTDRGDRLPGHGRAARGGAARPRPRCCCSSARTTRPARCTRRRRSRRSAAGPSSTGVWVVTDEIYEHLTYGPHEFVSMPTRRARPRRPVRRSSTASPRRTR